MTDTVLTTLDMGREAEAQARDWLVARGVTILMENSRCQMGELDLVALHGKVMIVVEVRLRTEAGFDDAAASVGWRKQQRIVLATQVLLLRHAELRNWPIRFDVVTLDRLTSESVPRINWIQHAFEARD